MQFNYLKEALDHLGKTHFQKTWPEASIKVASCEVEDIAERAMVKTVSRVMVEISPSAFPALKRIIDILKEEQVKINLAASPEEPKTRYQNDATPVLNRQTLGKMGMDSLRLIDGLLSGKLSRENFIEGMMVFNKVYPGIGWDEQAAQLAVYYSRNEREDA
jgi:hypothetical protein